jgi:predicted dinucleotide-binding enzyme
MIANSRGPESLAPVVAALGTGVFADTVREATAAGIVAIAVPYSSVPATVAGLQWDGQIVIDATNAFNPADLGGRTSSEIVADLVPGARLVKGANTFGAEVLAADPHEAGGRRVIFLSGDDSSAKAAVVELLAAAGFFPIDRGHLVTGGGAAGGRSAVEAQPGEAPGGQVRVPCAEVTGRPSAVHEEFCTMSTQSRRPGR